MADYLGYANSFNRMGNPIAEGLNQIGDTIQQNRLISLREATANREMALREAAAAREAESSGIQNRLSLANLNDMEARRAGAMKASGAATPEEMYTNEAIAEQQRMAQEQEAKGFQNYLNTIKALDEVKGIDATTKTLIGKEFLKKNPKYAAIADNLKYIDGKGVKAARQFAAGELKDPVTGQPLPAGYYETEGEWTGDPANPVRLTNYKLVKDKPDQMDLLLKRDELQSQRDEKNRRAADARLERTLSAKGQGGAPMGKAPTGYRYTPDGNLEPIPGGPAAAKAAAAQQSKGDSIAAIDLSIGTIDKLANHPGRQQATGKSRIMGVQKIPGTDAYDFDRELESFDAQLFLSNISQMKGMGALSNAEGAKVSAAAGAIKPGMSEDAFLANIREIQGTLKKARARLESGQLVNPDGSRQGGQPNSNKQPKQLDADTASKFLKRAGGNKDKARQLAKKEGYTF